MKRPFRLTSPVPLEYADQVALFEWAAAAAQTDPRLRLLYAIPNGLRASSIREAVRAKAAGLKAGVPDVCLPVACGGFHGLYLEMKRRHGKLNLLTAAQRDWLTRLGEQGYRVDVAFGFAAAKTIIELYLGEP